MAWCSQAVSHNLNWIDLRPWHHMVSKGYKECLIVLIGKTCFFIEDNTLFAAHDILPSVEDLCPAIDQQRLS